jgi:ATP-dependent RNA helicase DDX35
LTTPILQLKLLGIDDFMKFEWVTAPPAESILRALEGLVAARIVDDDGRLTVTGEQVAECPLEVGIARMVSFTNGRVRVAEMTVPFLTSCSCQKTSSAERRY